MAPPIIFFIMQIIDFKFVYQNLLFKVFTTTIVTAIST